MALILGVDADTKKATSKIKGAAKSAGKSIKQLETKSVASANKISSAFKGIAGALSIGLAIRAIDTLIDKFGIQEKAIARLDANTKNVLVSFRGFKEGSEALRVELERSTQVLRDQAKELQKTTTFGDEQTISAQAMLSTFALTTEQVMKLTPALLDMAAASEKTTGSQVDLEQIAIAIGKSLTIGVGALTRYGVVISDAARASFEFASDAEKVDIVLGELNKNFAGVAEAIAMTDIGKLEQFGNIIGDLAERGGALAVKFILPFINLLESIDEFGDKFLTGFGGKIDKEIVEPMKSGNEATQDFLDLLASIPPDAPDVPFINVPVEEMELLIPPMEEVIAGLGEAKTLSEQWAENQATIAEKVPELPENIEIVNKNMETAAQAAGTFSQNLARALVSGQGLEKALLSAAISLGLSLIPGGSLFGGFFGHGGIAPGGGIPSIVGESGGGAEVIQSASPIRVTPLTTNNRNDNRIHIEQIVIQNTGGELDAESVSRAFNEAVDLRLPIRGR